MNKSVNKLSEQEKNIVMNLYERKELWRQVANDDSYTNARRGSALNHMIEYDKAIKNVYTKKEQQPVHS